MMYGNGNYNPTASAAKAIIVFLLVVLIGAGALVMLASGNFGPEADARAQRIKIETAITEAQQRLALEHQKAENGRQREQAARDFELAQSLKDWGARAALIGVLLVAIIIAAGKSVQWIRASQGVAQPAIAQPAPPADATRLRNVYTLLEEMNNRLGMVQQQLGNTQMQVMATQHQLEHLQMHGNGSDPGSNIIPFERRA